MRKRPTARRRWPAAAIVILLVAAAAAGVWIDLRRTAPSALSLVPVAYSALPGWRTNDPSLALTAFRRSCNALGRRAPTEPMGGMDYAGHVGDWLGVCAGSKSVASNDSAARAWFQTHFSVFRVRNGAEDQALFTGYYEPEIRASLTAHGVYETPVYGLPRNLVTLDLAQFGRDLPDRRLVGQLAGQRIVPFPVRGAIDAAGLKDAPVLLYAADPVAVFFLHIQGSGRARLENGTIMRLAYAGQNGRTYTPIGRTLIEEGALDRQHMSMQAIRAWLESNRARARAAMESDQSFVFFRELPLGDPGVGSPGSEGVPLTPAASLAVDPAVHPFAVPMYVAARAPQPDMRKPVRAFDRLLISQDTGGAIRGALRADVFWGFGADAESVAGRMKSRGALFILLPKRLAVHLPQQILASR